MQTPDGTPMTRRQYLALVRSQERPRVEPETRRSVPLVLVPEPRKPRRRAVLRSVPSPHGVPSPRRG